MKRANPPIRRQNKFLSAGLICAFVFAQGLATQTTAAQQATTSTTPLSDRIVSYKIDVTLDPDARTLHGKQQLTWRNPDSSPVDELQFHLYLNAFRDSTSTFMVESGGRHRGFSASGPNKWGGIEIDRMVRVTNASGDRTVSTLDREPVDLTDSIRFIQPDDNNADDRTVVSVPLERPVEPGELITLDIEFTSVLPRVMARTGWEFNEDGSLFFMAAQWFPKIGVLEIPGQRFVSPDAERGRWNTHQFHQNSEFYANFGTYDVTITTPSDFEVGATGIEVNGSASTSASLTTRTFHAEDVHDFAWTASPAYKVFTDKWQHVDIKLLIQPGHKGQWKRHIAAAKTALEYFDKLVGEYPYTTLTLVDGIGGSNGMEYPTLITMGTVYGLPKWVRPLELVTIHEFGHQYFYGLLASNEFEEAWLDEGMNSYLETRIVDEAYGRGSVMSLPGMPIDDSAFQRLTYTESNPFAGALFTNTWEYGPGEYARNSYAKPATVMRTLERVVGTETMDQFLKEYYNTWRFRHPTTRDLQETFERVAGDDFDWFFNQFVYGTAVVDFEVLELSNEGRDGTWTSTVVIGRKHDGIIPVDVLVAFEDGSSTTTTWNSETEEEILSFSGPSPVTEVFIDPGNKVVLELTPLDNRRVVSPSNLYPTKMLFKTTAWMQGFLYIVQSLL